jgi:hypothetical protein
MVRMDTFYVNKGFANSPSKEDLKPMQRVSLYIYTVQQEVIIKLLF